MREEEIAIAIIAEPYFAPQHPCWTADLDMLVAIHWQPFVGPLPCIPLYQGNGFVIVECGDIVIVGCYVSPARSVADLQDFLDRLQTQMQSYRTQPVIVAGDFNSKSHLWGSATTTAKGVLLADWVAQQDLRVLNRGSSSTCIRW